MVAPRWSPVLQSFEGEQHKDREEISERERERGCHGGIENVEGTMRDNDIHTGCFLGLGTRKPKLGTREASCMQSS